MSPRLPEPAEQSPFDLTRLVGIVVLAPTSLHAAVIAVGLCGFGVRDWRTRTVPAARFDAWCLVVLALRTTPLYWPSAGFWCLTLGLLAGVTHGLGSADWLAITVIAALHPLDWSLWWVLLACGSAGIHHFVRRPQTLPLLAHLAIAYGLMRWWG
ncbi:peptidase [Lacticaseibacillus absianus]|uniref:peptidase n=1 Tax=Lacticaseibacillus absianus TaxID=2729623 RepID=UPI0015CE0F45|nr:peptidase [Lacticaseibacillus absianus]